ncbi:MarR family winged helix-turn-helix transcriptional regulator [Edaphobacter albus]|uniref:MarR family winged helix-turn-helix transcriptional regulator n=1 Tax=Edaphobacter sp. 4G125 TaxID=2763071 RepID=UPI0016454F14|nr:MarR family winged helix-turn-helix transcriptional regulator [Edaphobacter sp. 4G125]QNI36926.1 winged helix-turn-helix transcriptional regulator [Edaphobacter sp. 4G125]
MRIESFLEQSPVFQVSRIARRMESSLNAALKQEELMFSESLMLAAIFLEKKRVRPSELARTFETTRGNVSHIVSSLEAKRLVRRRIDPDDARGFLLELEPAGRRKAARVAGILDRMQSGIEREIGAAKLEAALRQMDAVEKLCGQLTRG